MPATAADLLLRDVILVDGSTVRLRAIQHDDFERLRDLFRRVSPQSRYLRFHSHVGQISDADLGRFTAIDYETVFGLVATLGEDEAEQIIGTGHYFRTEPAIAEVAFLVEDTHQGRGIATQILDALTETARAHGIQTFEAYVLGENRSMMDVFQAAGFPLHAVLKYGTLHVTFPIEPTEQADVATAHREAVAAAASLRVFFQPETIAVIGASRDAGTIGAEVFRNVVETGFTGTVYPVNPHATAVHDVAAYKSVLDIPGPVGLAIVIVPAAHVLNVVDECGRKGVRGLVVISAGFRETGEEGRASEHQLVEKARHYGMRLIGPNCMGVLNADPAVSFNGTFSPVFPPFGNVGLLSQSGALGLALLDHASALGIGLSTFVSVGNKADVSGNDLIQYWEQDPATDVILLYLESFGNPRKFARLAPRVTAKKPIIAVKSGRSESGSRAASSHTGALATVDVAVDALFRQSGVIRVDTLEEMFDVAGLLAHQPLPVGRRIGILTNAGGPGILAADACESAGLKIEPLSDETKAAMRRILPPEAGLSNPVDMIASATADQYADVLRLLVKDDSLDAIIVIFIPPMVTRAPDVARAIRQVVGEGVEKTILACFMMTKGAPKELSEGGRSVPSYIFPESAARALSHVADYAEWRKRPRGVVPQLNVNTEAARAVIHAALLDAPDGKAWLTPAQCAKVLDAYGIRSAPVMFAQSAGKAVVAARKLGLPVAMKVASTTITHKTDVGGVKLNLATFAEVERAYKTMREQLAALGRPQEMQGVTVQAMVKGGVEAIVGVTQDKSFGPLVMLGLGGTMVELVKDVQVRIQPLTDTDARDMIRTTKGYRLFQGWRGAPPADVSALEDMLLRISSLAGDVPEIADLDLNPVRVLGVGQGAIVVDARILVRLVP
ncbi:MAG: GNAT family N-acetyltransferase [Chloroflexota bacterium]